MKILHTVEFYYPSVGGMQEVVKQLSEHLVRLGHNVSVATTRLSDRKDRIINRVKVEEFAVRGNLVTGMKGDVNGYRQYLLDSKFDVITNFAAQQWATDAMITMLDKIKSVKVFVPTGFSRLYIPEYRGYFESMKSWMRKYDMNVFLSNEYRDINFARTIGIKKIAVIPNGAAEHEFLSETLLDIRAQLRIPDDHFLVLHVGSHTGLKGHAEAIKTFENARIMNATLLIVANVHGFGCAPACTMKKIFFNRRVKRLFDNKRLTVMSLSREETVAAYKAADLFLFPSNIECSPLVLFECMASKTPFLTTDVGNAREIIEWSKGGALLPTIVNSNGYSKADVTGSVSLLEAIYASPEKREEMREEGFKAWQERFTWEKITREYEGLYLQLLED